MVIGCCIALFVSVLVAWVAALATADRPDDRIESWERGTTPATLADREAAARSNGLATAGPDEDLPTVGR